MAAEQEGPFDPLPSMRHALFLLESPLLDHCIASSPGIPALRDAIGRLELERAARVAA